MQQSNGNTLKYNNILIVHSMQYRLDSGGGIRVGDFGLAEDVYASGCFRQNDRANVKLPYKWMALESLNDAIFTEKTDVVSQCTDGRPIYCL